MTLAISPAPVRRSVRVPADPARAFEVFTTKMARWWPPAYKIGPADRIDTVLEPKVGGRWYERDADGSECDWGRVIAWEPPTRLVLAWQIDGRFRYDPDLVTEVEVRFVADGPGATRVELEHRNLERYGEAAEAVRTAFDAPSGWQGVLDSYAAAVR